MNLKVRLADLISNIVYKTLGFFGKNLNHHVAMKNFIRSKEDNLNILDFSLFSFWNNSFIEKVTYQNAIAATKQFNYDNLSKRLRHYTMFQIVNSQNKDLILTGNVAECGCWQGQSAHGIASILKKLNFTNRFIIFDSFQGLSDLGTEDQHELIKMTPEQEIQQKNSFAASLDLVKNNLREFDFIDYYEGWVPSRFAEVANNKFSFVNIDVDLYQPIKDCLEFFYPRMLKGGCIFLDDYGMSQFPGAKTSVDEFLKNIAPTFFMWLPFGGAVLIK